MVKLRTWGWRNSPCPIDDKIAYLRVIKKRGLHREGKIGHANVIVFNMSDCRKVIEEFLSGKVKGYAGCSKCKIRPREVEATVKSDLGENN